MNAPCRDEQLAELVDSAMEHLPPPTSAGEERRMTFELFKAEFFAGSDAQDVGLKIKVPTF